MALSILRDARSKIYNPRYFGLYEPTTAYVMLIERVCGGRAASGSSYHSSRPDGLSGRRAFSEEQP